MKNFLLFFLFTFSGLNSFSQEGLEPGRKIILKENQKDSKGYNGPAEVFFFWGHIQQYKSKDGSILITFPDNHAEMYKEGKLVENIQCLVGESAITLKKGKLHCLSKHSTRGVGRAKAVITFGFWKEDLILKGEVEKRLDGVGIILKSLEDGFELKFDWDYESIFDYLNIEKNYKYSCKDCPYIFVETKYVDISKGYIDKIKNDIFVNIYEKKNKVSADWPCKEYAYNLLGRNKIECPYIAPIEMDRELAKKYFPCLFENIIYDYNLPHEKIY